MTPRTTSSNQKATYAILSIIIAALVILIAWFTYLLIKPSDSDTSTNSSALDGNSNKNKNANKTSNKNKANSNATNTNANKSNTNNTNSNTNEAGLVEPDTNSNTNTNSSEEDEENEDGTETITLYFPKDTAACGTVHPVERNVTPSDDFYGQIVLEDIHGPSDTETGYTTAIPAGLRLREVRYSSDGPIITVNEAFDELSDCDQKTVTAQLVKTANAMFDLPDSTEGEVVVGEVSEDTSDAEDTSDDTNTNSAE